MNREEHLFYSLAIYEFFFSGNYLILLGVLLGTLVPDFDIYDPKSRNLFINFIFQVYKSIFKLFENSNLGNHRKVSHSIWFIVLFSLPLLLLSLSFKLDFLKYFILGFVVGYLSHIYLDMATVKGISLFYPLSEFNICGILRSSDWFVIVLIFLSFILEQYFKIGWVLILLMPLISILIRQLIKLFKIMF
jgi:inner membrane protein